MHSTVAAVPQKRLFSNADLRSLIVPLVIEQILVMMVGMVDTMMISYVGEAAISGVALVDMVNVLVITVLSALATGGAVVVSQYLGNNDSERASSSASQIVAISTLFSLAAMVICLVLHRGILTLLFGTVEPAVMDAAVTYFAISALSFPFMGVYNAAAALFRSMKNTKVTMYVSLLMNVINIVGNAIGIFVLKAGVAGVAVPTLIARAVAAIVLFALLTNTHNEVSVSPRSVLGWNGDVARRILRIAVPNGIENGLFTLGRVLVTSIVALFGTTQIAANGVAGGINMVAILVVNSVNLAIVTVVGQCVGAQEYEQASYYTRKLMRVSYLSTGILTLLVWAVLPVLLGLYQLSPETYSLSFTLVMLHNLLAFALHPTAFNLANAIRAAGDAKFTMYVGVASMLVFRLGVAVVFGVLLQMGVLGVYVAMGVDWLARSVAFTLRYRSGKWREHRAI